MTLHDPDAVRHAVIPASRCITPRHLFERIVSSVTDALDRRSDAAVRCETLAQLDVELTRLLKYEDRGADFRFVLVLDGIDKARDPPPTLVPALARLSEIVRLRSLLLQRTAQPLTKNTQIPCLTTVFIVTSPPAHHLRTPSSATLLFPPYDKSALVQILSLPEAAPAQPIAHSTVADTLALWARFCAAVHDALVRSAARSLPSFRTACETLWPRFIAPVERGLHTARDFSKLLVAARAHFQDETLLNPSIVSVRPPAAAAAAVMASKTPTTDLAALLPRTARVLLLCAYLASHNAPRHDVTLFSTHHQRRRRRASHKQGGHKRIARKLLGAHAFVLERMLAIFAAVRTEWIEEKRPAGTSSRGVDGDVGVALATLASLRLLSRVGVGGDVMDRGGKWRVNVGWEVVRGVGRSMGVEVEEWLIE